MSASENGAGGERQGRSAARTAAVVAASSAAVMAARHAIGRSKRGGKTGGGALAAGLHAAWEAAQHVVLPAIEEGAASAGRYVAENAPAVITDSILPRFLDSFQEARERSEADAAYESG